MDSRQLLKFINWWPPYLASGIKVLSFDQDFTHIQVQLKQRFYNTNYVGTHYGGSLYSMCDPWHMFILMQHLGKDYIVWDKAAKINFKSPGRKIVKADFKMTLSEIEDIKTKANQNYKYEPVFHVQVLGEDGKVVAEVEKLLYVKKKEKIESQK